MSVFTPIEFAFRAIKNITYKKLYSEINDVHEDIIFLFNCEGIKNALLYNYKEALNQYIFFLEKKNENLNYYILEE